MSYYYYLTSSLPMLVFEGKSTISIQKFTDFCLHLTKDRDFLTIRNALINFPSTGEVSNPVLTRWQEYEFGLRNELVKLRAREKGVDQEPYLKQEYNNPLLTEKARKIFEAENPLKAEMIFNRMLWDQCDELETGQMFNLEFLIIYHLRLQILDRIKSFIPEKGRQKLESIIPGEVSDE